MSLWFGGFAVGCFFIDTLSDRLGRRKPVIIGVTHCHALIWPLPWFGVSLPLTISYAPFALLGELPPVSP